MNKPQNRRVSETRLTAKRKCRKCNNYKPLDEKHFQMLSNYYLSHTCKVCFKKKSRQHYHNHKPVALTTIAFGD